MERVDQEPHLGLAYHFYGGLLARLLKLHSSEEAAGMAPRPSEWPAFAFQLAVIVGLGGLTGPVVAAQYGFLPGVMWIVFGAVVAGAVHDGVIMLASAQAGGASLTTLLRQDLGPAAGRVAQVLVLLGLLIAIGGLGGMVARSLAGNAWAGYSFFVSILAALLAAGYARQPARAVRSAGLLWGLGLMLLGMFGGGFVAGSPLGSVLSWPEGTALLLLLAYLFAATSLPAAALTTPRVQLFGLAGLGLLGGLAVMLALSAPPLAMPAVIKFAAAGSPLAPGGLWPFLILVVGGGAVSGYHALTTAGPSAALLRRPENGLRVGFGAMLAAGFFGVVLLTLTATLQPGDFFAIATSPAVPDLAGVTGFQATEMERIGGVLKQPLAASPNPFTAAAVAVARTAAVFPAFPAANQQTISQVYQYAFSLALVAQMLFVLAGLEALCRAGRGLLEELLAGRNGADNVAGPASKRPYASVATGAIVAAVTGMMVLADGGGSLTALLEPAGTVLAVLGLGLAAAYWWRRSQARNAGASIPFLLPMALMLAASLWGGATYATDRYWRSTDPKVAFGRAYGSLVDIGTQMGLPRDPLVNASRGFPANQATEVYFNRGVDGLGKELGDRMGQPSEAGLCLAGALKARAESIARWGGHPIGNVGGYAGSSAGDRRAGRVCGSPPGIAACP
ncbi:MAG: hypothetical protein M1531_05595 [Chloroflexi bacterium]|nr:hypothetical protein [Chloroflexota bacterium]